MKLLFSFLIFSLFFFSCEVKKKNNDETPDPPASGLQVFSERCVVCHGNDGTMGFNGAKNLKESTLSVNEIKNIVTNGKGAMTPFKMILDDIEIDSVAKYILKLRK